MAEVTGNRRKGAAHSERQPPAAGRFWSRTFALALVGAFLLWAALPPLQFSPLALLAPIPWIVLIRLAEMPGRRPYRAIWAAGFLFWFAMLHWIRMPHPATSIGWVALSGYLAFYLPLYVGLARVAVHRLGISAVIAAPVAWTGLELARGHVLGGFTMASLGHTQYRWTELIQVSDLAGAYGVGFVVMFLAACLGRMLPISDTSTASRSRGAPRGPRHASHRRFALWPAAPAALMLAAVLAYGYARTDRGEEQPAARIALIQGSIDITLQPDPDRPARMHRQYAELSQEAVERYGRVDLIVWPETVFGDMLLTAEQDAAPPGEWSGEPEDFQERIVQAAENSRLRIAAMAKVFEAAVLVGCTRQHFGPEGERIYNAAVFARATGEFVGWYDKMHLVMFGEYFPFADKLTWLYNFTPVNTLGLGVQPGSQPRAFDLDRLRIAPNICYESVVPQVIRRQVNQLAAEGCDPDVLINLTNDGWFFGSNELDLHMICGVFRAVESRKPFLIAANTGISAWIDGDGRIREQGPRRATGTILAEVVRDRRTSLYLWWGDLPAGICLAACALCAAVGLVDRYRRRTRRPEKQPVPSPVPRDAVF